VLKKIGLIDQAGVPSASYDEFMKPSTGPAVLAEKIRETYAKFFEASHTPHTDADESLRNILNIHSGGGDDAMRCQLQTFKALCEHADFNALVGGQLPAPALRAVSGKGGIQDGATGTAFPQVNIALHIHLPENKSSRDYQTIIEDIGRYIFGREVPRE